LLPRRRRTAGTRKHLPAHFVDRPRGQRHRGAPARAQSQAHAREPPPNPDGERARGVRREASVTTVSARYSSTRSRRTSSQSLHRGDDSAGDVDVMAAIANYSFGTNSACVRVFGLESSHFDGSVTGACEWSLRSRGMVDTRLPMSRHCTELPGSALRGSLLAEQSVRPLARTSSHWGARRLALCECFRFRQRGWHVGYSFRPFDIPIL
jgi:hypothetical protein